MKFTSFHVVIIVLLFIKLTFSNNVHCLFNLYLKATEHFFIFSNPLSLFLCLQLSFLIKLK